MVRLMRRCAAALVLVILAGGPANGLVRAADENTDLEIKLVNLPLANGQREVQVQVKNVSKWWADGFTVTVETVKPTAGHQVTQHFDDADPGQTRTFTYTLAAGCDGHVVKAEVSAAKNYEGVPESTTSNNKTGEVQVCPPAGSSSSAGASGAGIDTNRPGLDPNKPESIDTSTVDVVTKPAGSDSAPEMLPEPLRPGLHTYAYDPSAELTLFRYPSECGDRMRDLNALGAVGWDQYDYSDQSCWSVRQTAVNFDLSQVGQTQYKNPTWVAMLRYNEGHMNWRRDNTILSHGNCVEVLALATQEWRGRQFNDLFPNDQVLGHTPGVQEWYVTDYVRRMLEEELPGYGFVLRGGNESPEGHGWSSCLSTLDKIQLVVSYAVN